jgi:hypothetical protein
MLCHEGALKVRRFYFSAGVGAGAVVAAGTLVAAGAAGVGAGATGCSCLGSAPKGSSFNGPLVALMPVAGFAAGMVGISRASGLAGAAVSADVDGVGAPAGLVASSVWATDGVVCASAAVGGTGAVAPAGSGAKRVIVSLRGL